MEFYLSSTCFLLLSRIYVYIGVYSMSPCFLIPSRIYLNIGVYSMFPLFSTPVQDICIYRSILHVPPVFYSPPGYIYTSEYTSCPPVFYSPPGYMYKSEYTPCSPCFLLPSRIYVYIGVYSMFPLFSTPVQDICKYQSLLNVPPIFYSRPTSFKQYK